VPVSANHRHEAFQFELPDLTRQDRARFVKEARRRRAEEMDKLVRAAGRGIARAFRALAAPLARASWPRERTT
jgi:hypothetical protein